MGDGRGGQVGSVEGAECDNYGVREESMVAFVCVDACLAISGTHT
jgi:hypothetical protein